ncbi:hypothetical protein JR316_0006985 [Psilocybe cubensis]|uniref:Uncharacterized protein n=1 Tax=Psilocybe cubensis TaxID=181762 RepID=A0ACB8GYC7_PSICU|nr:hypothetical protein JR316_0006985 [Psilocybe cubensis]KAH9480387.1 hypothetical protein JR316_0006985 [Psilocybe cubensis]
MRSPFLLPFPPCGLMVVWAFLILMVIAGLTAICTLWCIFCSLKDWFSRKRRDTSCRTETISLPHVRPQDDSLIPSSAPRPHVEGRPITLTSSHDQNERDILSQSPLHSCPQLSIQSPLLTANLDRGDEPSTSTPLHIRPPEIASTVNPVGGQHLIVTPPPLAQGRENRSNRERTRSNSRLGGNERAGYRLVTVLLPEDHPVFTQRGETSDMAATGFQLIPIPVDAEILARECPMTVIQRPPDVGTP